VAESFVWHRAKLHTDCPQAEEVDDRVCVRVANEQDKRHSYFETRKKRGGL